MVSIEYSEAAVEVLGILNELEDKELKKIPQNIIDFFENNKSKTYNPDIDYTESVEKLSLKEKTREILAGLYLDYLCPEEEKQEYINKLRYNDIKYQEKLKEQYNVDNIFNNRKISNTRIEIEKNALTIAKKENFWIKIIKKLKNIFKIAD